MRKISIIVEGEGDQKFIKDLLKSNGIVSLPILQIKYSQLGGKDDSAFDRTKNEFYPTQPDALNILVIDADDDDLIERRIHLKNKIAGWGCDVEIFFFPNDIDPGNFETLLKKLVWEKYKTYFDCFVPFDECVTKVHNDIRKPSEKDKIYIFFSSLLSKDEEAKRGEIIGPKFMNYADPRFLDINHQSLKPLKDFLLKYVV